MAEVTLSSAVRSNLLSLQNTADLLSKTQERLATGLKVNSALDDPNAFFTASSLNARGSDLNRLLDSVGLGVQTIKAADEGISALTTLVESAQATARQALQASAATFTAATVTGTGASISADVNASEVGTGTFDTSAAGGSFTINGETITFLQNDTIADVEALIDGNATLAAAGITASQDGSALTITGTADTTLTLGGANLAAVGLDSTTSTAAVNLISQSAVAQGETLTIGIGSNANTITFGTGAGEVSTLAELATELGGITGGTASVDASGNLTVTAGNTTDSITLGGTATLTNFGTNLTTTAVAATVGTASTERTNLESEFNSILSQINQLAADASFNGNNLLQGDNLTVIFNEDGSSSLSITGVDFSSTGLGLTAPSGDGFQSDTEINASLTQLDTAIGTLRSQASTFGSNLSVVEVREQFTKGLINTLETGAAGLTLADTNEEGANLLALQTRQQLSSVALSLASQADQNVLRLIG